MSTSSRRRAARVLGMLAKNPDLARKIGIYKPHEVDANFEDADFLEASLEDTIRTLFANPHRRRPEETPKLPDEQIERICRTVAENVYGRIHSEISGIREEIRGPSLMNRVAAMSGAIQSVSRIPEVRQVYLYPEPDGFRFLVIHDSSDRLSMLRSIVGIEDDLEERFLDVYLDFTVLHQSETDEASISGGKPIFIRV